MPEALGPAAPEEPAQVLEVLWFEMLVEEPEATSMLVLAAEAPAKSAGPEIPQPELMVAKAPVAPLMPLGP